MRVRTLGSLALGRVPSEQWDALDEHLQQSLFPAELRRAIARFQRAVLARRNHRRAAFARALVDQETKLTVRLENPKNTIMAMKTARIDYPPIILKGDHLVVMRGGCTWHGIALKSKMLSILALRSDRIDVPIVVSGQDGKMRVVDLDAFLGGQSTFGIVRYLMTHVDRHRVTDLLSTDLAPTEFVWTDFMSPMLECSDQHRKRTVELAMQMTKMHPEDLREYDVILQNPQCFAWACWTGRLIGGKSVLDAIDRDIRKVSPPRWGCGIM